ncbi:Poly(A) polymerase [Morus notabilis]|uniref:Poly(A) polymerase n=1 Tax=Morus notabilis TaxID=981085 RepID=W9SCP1_9ROSA|nr:Poly(A) polymerase [Morus notabilis]
MDRNALIPVCKGPGFDAYLVGGCVRDLLLNKIPKDFDVITTANLDQIKKQFRRAIIVGQRFPICRVHIQGSVTEWLNRMGKKKNLISPKHHKAVEKETLCSGETPRSETSQLIARILRGLRIAARLGLSFSKDTETAIYDLSSSILKLARARIMMELNYMLSYGAAKPSLCLLQKFNLLKIVLPIHAAYLEQQASKKSDENSLMLMELFFNLDKVVSCDRPSDCRLWVGLLAFHLALVNNPQDPFVVLAFASIFYHGDWKEGIRFAKENAEVKVNFAPELSRSFTFKSDKQLVEEVSQLASFVQDSIDVLTDTESLFESMSSYPTSPCSGLVFVSKKVGQDVAVLFELLVNHIGCYEKRRENFDVDYHLLGKGYLWETRFVLGKVILETMGCATSQRKEEAVKEKSYHETMDENCNTELSCLVKKELLVKDGKPSILVDASEVKQELAKKRKLNVDNCILSEWETTLGKEWMTGREMCEETGKKQQKVDGTNQLYRGELISVPGNLLEKTCQVPDDELIVIEKKKEDAKTKKRKSEDERPLVVVERQHLLEEDEGVNEKKKGEVKKKKKKHKDSEPVVEKHHILRDEEVFEKKKEDGKKTKCKSKDQRPLTLKEKHHILQDEEVIEKKKENGKKKQKLKIKDRRPLALEEKHRILQDEEVIEKKKEDVEKKKRKSREDQGSSSKHHKLQDVRVIEKKEGDVHVMKKCKSKEERPAKVVEVEKTCHTVEEHKVAQEREAVRVMSQGKRKKVVVKENGSSSRTLLSDLFR